MAPSVLDRPLYSVAEAARLLDVTSQKLRRWLDGFTAAGKPYPPVIRPQTTGDDRVTWAEFVEAGFLREYRTKLTLQRLRPLIDAMRRDFDVPYPLAHFKPAVDPKAKELVLALQEAASLDPQLALVRRGTEWQVMWAEPAAAFLEKVEFDPRGVAQRMRPLGGESPVVIDPEVAFGIPQIRGIRTETIAEAYATGETFDDIAASWRLTVPEAEAAVRWELTIKAA